MGIIELVVILFILLFSIIILVLLSLEEILKFINQQGDILRWFITQNSGFFKVLFILLFLIEQIIFILIINKYFEITKWAGVFIGVFALIVITTASFQVFVWEHKYYTTKLQFKTVKNVGLITQRYDNLVRKLTSRLDKE